MQKNRHEGEGGIQPGRGKKDVGVVGEGKRGPPRETEGMGWDG